MTRPFRSVHSRSILPKRDARLGEAVMMLCNCPTLGMWTAQRLETQFHLKPATAAKVLADERGRRERNA